ncbi:Cysteine-rich secretory protein family protein [Cnuella takakiae]|uniref:Cysteine-rich secretory protein family protein n=2 Tax=Cnuella takakiae TaxID=1302690 RepID=A0A1M4T940_9BACT|nr:Cysteine-rich secretory protein family protein [Cnuella takakiae]
MPALKWNDTLARVAAQKALDMATRNYFAHTNPDGFGMNYFINQAGYKLQPSWIQDKTANYFESCAAGATTGKEAIAMLLVDDGVPSFGHRTHLLGLNDWSRSLVDIGIGYAWAGGASNYISYTCVLIAKH